MPTPDDIRYALEATKVLHEPGRLIDTFHSTRFEFEVLTPLMDSVTQTRIRRGEMEAQRPRIIRPEGLEGKVDVEGFGENAGKFFEWLKENEGNLAVFRYGFLFRRGEVSEKLVDAGIGEVRERVVEAARREGNPMRAVIEGVDDTWEVSLLRFTMQMIQKSGELNAFDFKRKGLI